MANTSVDMDKIVSLCKRRGFIFQSSEIYGGLASTFDYGPYGVELKRNVKEAWWRAMIWERDDMVGLDAAILMHPEVWVASGHVAGFHDPLVECGVCNQRFRPDQISYAAVLDPRGDLVGYEVEQTPSGTLSDAEIVRAAVKRHPSSDKAFAGSLRIGKRSAYMDLLEKAKELPCPLCGEVGKLTEPREFSLMFKTHVGPVEDSASIAYLRPETAQGIFVNFGNIQTTTRRKLPFGVGQIGKSFRNEITPGNFIFRTREFEQMEIEYFCPPDQGFKWHDEWKKTRMGWYSRYGINPEHLRFRDHGADELAHYAKATADIEYLFPFGWGEIEGIAYRTDFDLKAHQERSGKPLTYFDEEKKEHYVPHVVEPSCGVDRPLLAFLVDAYVEEDVRGETRTVLKLHKALAPVKVAILPLSRNEKLSPKAREVYQLVRRASLGYVEYDDAQSIGRRYRRQDEIGTPLCVTVDFETVEKDNAVTIRDRDTMEQVRVPVDDLVKTLVERLRS